MLWNLRTESHDECRTHNDDTAVNEKRKKIGKIWKDKQNAEMYWMQLADTNLRHSEIVTTNFQALLWLMRKHLVAAASAAATTTTVQ